jgi:hypothetical protein
MSDLRLRLPDSLHRKLREIAEEDDVSINQFIATAVAEKAAAYLTVEYLEQRARRADPSAFDLLLDRVPDVAPIPGDELMPAAPPRKRKSRAVRGRSRARRA